jgi:hypothetical protein
MEGMPILMEAGVMEEIGVCQKKINNDLHFFNIWIKITFESN